MVRLVDLRGIGRVLRERDAELRRNGNADVQCQLRMGNVRVQWLDSLWRRVRRREYRPEQLRQVRAWLPGRSVQRGSVPAGDAGHGPAFAGRHRSGLDERLLGK